MNLTSDALELWTVVAMNGVVGGLGLTVCVACVLTLTRRWSSAARHSVWGGTLLCVVGMMFSWSFAQATGDGESPAIDGVILPTDETRAVREANFQSEEPGLFEAATGEAPAHAEAEEAGGDRPERLAAHGMDASHPAPRVAAANPAGTNGAWLRLPGGSWPVVLFMTWLTVASLLLARLIWSWRLLARLKKRSVPVSPEIEKKIAKLAMRRRIGIAASFRESGDIGIPVAAGLFRPAILFPIGLRKALTEQEFEQVWLHEMAHLVRRDDWSNLFQQIARALFFFHPAVHWISRQMDHEREIACDDWVVATTGEARPYASCLTRLAELTQISGRPSLVAGAWSGKKQLVRRIDMLLNRNRKISARPSRSGFVCASVALAFAGMLTLPSMTFVAVAEPDDDEQEERKERDHKERETRERRNREDREQEHRVRRERGQSRQRPEPGQPGDRGRIEAIEKLERALDKARERRERGVGSDAEIQELERALRGLREAPARGRFETHETQVIRRADATEEQRDLIRQQIALLDEALEREEVKQRAGGSDAERVSELRMQRLQFERELIRHAPERGEREINRERDIVRQQIEIATRDLERMERLSEFMDKPGASFDVKMRLLGLKRELAELNAPKREIRIIRRESHDRHGEARSQVEMEMRHRGHLERHERAVREHQERSRQLHEQAERRMEEARKSRERSIGNRRGGPDARAREQSERERAEALEREKIIQRERAMANEKQAREQRARLERMLEEERKRREDLEAELKRLRALLEKQAKDKARD